MKIANRKEKHIKNPKNRKKRTWNRKPHIKKAKSRKLPPPMREGQGQKSNDVVRGGLGTQVSEDSVERTWLSTFPDFSRFSIPVPKFPDFFSTETARRRRKFEKSCTRFFIRKLVRVLGLKTWIFRHFGMAILDFGAGIPAFTPQRFLLSSN